MDRAELAETVADEFEATFERRLGWWRDKAAEIVAALAAARERETLKTEAR